MKKEREIPFKNYIILAVVLILTIIAVIYLFMWNRVYEKNKLQTPILDKYLLVINYNELNNYIVENKNAVIYTSVLNNVEIRNFEEKFKNIIEKNNLNNKILYLDLTKELQDKNTIKEINKKYNNEITKVPSILIFKDGNLDSIYSIQDEKYNTTKLEEYLKEEDVIND